MKTIEVMDYLTESEMKDIAKQVFREVCQDKYKKDHERIISNSGYEIIVKLIKEHYPENLEELVANKAIQVINDLSPTTLFGCKNAWDKETTGGFEALQSAIKNNLNLINEKATQMISDYKCLDNEEYIMELLREEIASKMFKPVNN